MYSIEKETAFDAVDSSAYLFGGADATAAKMANWAAHNMTAQDAALASPNAFLVSELEKRDPDVRKPLATVTWSKNIPVRVGGGWIDHTSNLFSNFGGAGDSNDSLVAAGGATVLSTTQANFGKDTYKTHPVIAPISINEIDMLREQITGRSLDAMLAEGVQLRYQKHMDKNVFIGLPQYGTYGLLNNPSIYATSVAQGTESGNPTQWSKKTGVEILKDVNDAIIYTWGQSGNDMGAIPNHILLPFEQYNLLNTRLVTEYNSTQSIMKFLMDNNIAKINGENLVFGVSLYNKGAGTGGMDRMAVYCSKEKYIAVDELVPLTRQRTVYSAMTSSYDTNYIANVSQVEFFQPLTVSYWDGI